jgi:molybdenum cofactor biosynthesis protein B
MPAPQHHKDQRPANCAVITVSDTRTEETDTGGQLLRSLLESAGHHIHSLAIVKDEPADVAELVRAKCCDKDCHAVLLSGGTGIAARDTTVEAILPLLDKRLDGFGELFRMLSYDQVGAAAMLSRALAGIVNQTAVFLMPGSPKAVELAMTKLIIPELGHIVALAGKSKA